VSGDLMLNKEHVIDLAKQAFGTEEKAYKWLGTYHVQLGAKPNEYLESPEGLLMVTQILNSIQYGGVV
jgi:uncharacterized protein (DUF2384 family)